MELLRTDKPNVTSRDKDRYNVRSFRKNGIEGQLIKKEVDIDFTILEVYTIKFNMYNIKKKNLQDELRKSLGELV